MATSTAPAAGGNHRFRTSSLLAFVGLTTHRSILFCDLPASSPYLLDTEMKFSSTLTRTTAPGMTVDEFQRQEQAVLA